MRLFLLGIIVTLLVIPLAGYFYIRSSYMPVAATDAPLPLEKRLASIGLHARIKRDAPPRDVSGFTTADLVSGAQVYQNNCAYCHGLPQQPGSFEGLNMFPQAPQLFTPDGSVSDDPASMTDWKVQNGIRLTGMPAFKTALTDRQMWQVSALLGRPDKLPPEVQDALKPVIPAPPVAAQPGTPKAK